MIMRWDLTKKEAALIAAIEARAKLIYEHTFWTDCPDWQGYRMSLAACHCNGCPLDFESFLNANEIEFMHDFLEINRHVSRETGRLQNGFSPLFADYSKEVLPQY